MADYSVALEEAKAYFYRESCYILKNMRPNLWLPRYTVGRLLALSRDSVISAYLRDQLALPLPLLGAGYYSSVYDLTSDKVLKISFHRDLGYEYFINFCIESESKHIPRVYEQGEWLGLKYYVLEKLKPIDYEKSTIQYDALVAFINRQVISEFLGTELLKTVLNLGGSNINDLHDENVMYRSDGTLVITDPGCFY